MLIRPIRAQPIFQASSQKQTVTMESRLEQILNHAQIGILRCDADGRIVDANQALAKLLQRPHSLIQGAQVWDLFPSSNEFRDRWDALLRSPATDVAKWSFEPPNGQRVWIELHLSSDLSGSTPWVDGVATDLSERVRREQDRWFQEKRLHQTAQRLSLSELLARISHEINQPLGAIANYSAAAEACCDRTTDPQQLKEPLRQINEQAHRAAEIIRRLKRTAGISDVRLVDYDLTALVKAVLNLLAPELQQEGIDVRCNLPADPVISRIDPAMIQQVLVHLIWNAVEAMSECEVRKLTITAEKKEDGTWLSVADHGPGVSPDLQTTIFEPFFTTHESRMGLGLAISSRIVQSHHGKIAVHTNAHGGTTMLVCLPQQTH